MSAAEELQALKASPVYSDMLSNLDFRLAKEDVDVLRMAAWLHDVGKSTATTVDGTPFRSAADFKGRIQAIGHEKPEHYAPQVERLLAVAPASVKSFYEANQDIINFLIERHMDFSHGGFPRDVVSKYMDNGSFRNERPIRLLLVLMWADKMGRGKAPDLARNIEQLRLASEKSRRMSKRSVPFGGSEEEFRSLLRSRGLDDASIDAAVRSKFAGR